MPKTTAKFLIYSEKNLPNPLLKPIMLALKAQFDLYDSFAAMTVSSTSFRDLLGG